jgi:hypothetical protein
MDRATDVPESLAQMRRVLRPGGEPQPDPAASEPFPDDFDDLSTRTCFLCFVLEVPPSAAGWTIRVRLQRSLDVGSWSGASTAIRGRRLDGDGGP